jgi:hypothetical protein
MNDRDKYDNWVYRLFMGIVVALILWAIVFCPY